MIIDQVLVSTDDNDMYYDFWLPCSRIWRTKMGIVPTLLYFGDRNPSTEFGNVVRFNEQFVSSDKIPTYLKTLWARYWYPSTQPDQVFCISDIDMFPLNREYFTTMLSDFPDTAYIHMLDHKPLPSCYHVAKGSAFKAVLELPESFDASLKTLMAAKCATPHSEFAEFVQWGSDEAYATAMIENKIRAGAIDFRTIQRKPATRRLDRSHWHYDPKDIATGVYLDAHSIRPYSKYQSQIEDMLSLIGQTSEVGELKVVRR